ncbi:hypothetical protein RQP46_004362 [Phenoliferia psychrophenolica]
MSDDEDKLTLNLKGSGDESVAFTCKKTTLFKKILKHYAAKKGQHPSVYRLIFEGQNVVGTDTPETHDLEDGDIIEVHLSQTGGAASDDGDDSESQAAKKKKVPQISLSISSHTHDPVQFLVKRSIKMRKVFASYADRIGVDGGSLRFSFDGTKIGEEDTPDSLEMDDDDEISAHAEQIGGLGG